MLFIAIVTTLICLLWIALDSGTSDVFIVYGREMRTAWQMAAWSAFVSCGWRLLIIVGVICLNVVLAYLAVFRAGEDLNMVMIASWCLAVLLAFGLVPWTFLVRALHQRRATNAAAMTLTETATHLCTIPDLSSELECAAYNNDSGWEAWHPTSEDFESPRGKAMWSGAVPVIYTSTDTPRTVVIPIGPGGWSNFCVWGAQPSFAHPGQLLPFGGPGKVRFRAGSGIRQLQKAGGCWIVQAELECPGEN